MSYYLSRYSFLISHFWVATISSLSHDFMVPNTNKLIYEAQTQYFILYYGYIYWFVENAYDANQNS